RCSTGFTGNKYFNAVAAQPLSTELDIGAFADSLTALKGDKTSGLYHAVLFLCGCRAGRRRCRTVIRAAVADLVFADGAIMRLQRIGKYMGTIAMGDKKQFCALCRMQSRFQRFATSQRNGCGRQAAMTISIPDIGGIAQMAAAQIAAEGFS